ncbi:MAG: hypothetical protein PHR44_03845 [Candidatus Omnitrophica bacterium]|nr:hypothetical protein [Candidatus Omnitrophota bacterium]
MGVRFKILTISLGLILFLSCVKARAAQVQIVFTGEAHSALYPCDCPKEPDGGVARRAGAIKELRKKAGGVILLETGGFFAGGMQDTYSQNVDFDKNRTQVYLRSLELMGYDAVGIGDDEFNFGPDFLKEVVQKSGLRFLSANVGIEKIAPYTIKEIEGMRFGIIGVTTMSARQKAGIVGIKDAFSSVKQYAAELKAQGADFIILLSHMGEEEDVRLLDEVSGIDIVVVSHSRVSNEIYSKRGEVILVRPAWQGRRLGILKLEIKDKKIIDSKAEDMRLSDQVPDDPDALSILPQCFQDSDCKKGQLKGACGNPGTKDASCSFSRPLEVKLTVINSKQCLVCNTEQTIGLLKSLLPGLDVKYLDHNSRAARKIISEVSADTLPVYLLDKGVKKAARYGELKPNLTEKKDFIMVNPQFAGVGYFMNRERIKPRLDVFLTLYDKNTPKVLDAVRKFNARVHFLATQTPAGDFSAPGGLAEIEEDLRSACVMNLYPDKAYDYLRCRSANIASSWWDDCARDMDLEKIRSCAKSEDGRKMLKENVALNKELQLMHGPTYLINNVEIASSVEAPQPAELKRLIEEKNGR